MAKKTSSKKTTSKKTVQKSAGKKKAVKKSAKKSAVKKTTTSTSKHQSNTWMLIVGVLIIIAGIFLVLQVFSPQSTSEPNVAAIVNGQEITLAQLNTQYAILPDVYKQQYTKRMVLEQLVDEELLLIYAKENGIEITPEQVNEEIQSILATGALTVEQLEENLDRFNFTIEDFENLIERKLFIEKGTDLLFANVEGVSEASIRSYYEENEEEFIAPREVHVRHILVASQRENAAQLSKTLKEEVEAGADFCALVTEHTDDKGSLENCGEYTFGRGFMVPEFEAASFSLEKGEVTVVQTAFGYHIIEKLDDIPARTVGFEEVEDQIRSSLEQQLRAKVYSDFIAEQKANANVEIFLE